MASHVSHQPTMTSRVLESLAESMRAFGRSYCAYTLSGYKPNALVFPDLYFARWNEADRRRARRALYELRRKKMIHIERQGKIVRLTLTDAGRRRALASRLHNAPRCASHECVLVTFDIPESARRTRRLFRSFLATHHFEQVQKSVWVTDRDVADALATWVRDMDAEAWIHIYTARRIVAQGLSIRAGKN